MSNLNDDPINKLRDVISLSPLLKKFSSENVGMIDEEHNYILKPGRTLVKSFYNDAKKDIEGQVASGTMQQPENMNNAIGSKVIEFLETRKKICYENKEKWNIYFYASAFVTVLSIGLMVAGFLVALIAKDSVYWAMFGGGFILALISGYFWYRSRTSLDYYTEVYNNYYNTDI